MKFLREVSYEKVDAGNVCYHYEGDERNWCQPSKTIRPRKDFKRKERLSKLEFEKNRGTLNQESIQKGENSDKSQNEELRDANEEHIPHLASWKH